jgi:phage-related minor tail protein
LRCSSLDLFGKSGAEQLKLFKALEEQGGRNVILTAEQIKQADDFADKQAKARAELTLYASALATQTLPAITAFTSALSDAAKEMLGVGNESNRLGQNQGVAAFAENAVDKLAFVVDAAQGVKVVFSRLGEFIGASAAAAEAKLTGNVEGLKAIREAYNDSLDTSQFKSVRASYQKALQDQKEFRAQAARENRGFTPNQNVLDYAGKTKGGGGSKDDPTKKLLENDLKAFKAQGEQAKDLLADRNKILDLYNSQGLISVQDYYAALRGNAEEATAAQSKALDDQIKALRDFQAKAPKETDRADAQGKINDLLTQQSKLQREAGTSAIEMGVKQQQAAQAYRDSLNEVNAKILELDGNLGKAAEIRFDAQNRQLRALAEASGDFASVAQIDRLREYTKAQADINAVQAKFSLAQGDLQIAEERITQARERGTMGEIDGLRASGEARRTAISVMQEQLKAFEALDAASRTPEQAQAIERLKLQLESLKSTIDPLADRFNQMFSDAAGNAFGDFITGTKSAKDAFRVFATSVINDIGRIIAKDLAKSLFSGGSGGGFGGALSSLFGGAGGGAASGGGSDALGAFIQLGGYASGGFTGVGAANDPAGIVHKGEYVLNAEQTRQIGVANLDSGNFGAGPTVFNVNVPAGTSRQSGTQIAAEAERKLAAGRRNR